MAELTDKHQVSPEHAPKFIEWIQSRGGIAIWRSVNLSNPSGSWSTPALTVEGQQYPKPTWEAANEPERIITDPAEIEVVTAKEVKRFHVAVRAGRNNPLSFKCTDASSARIRKAVEKAGDGAWYEFDYSTQEAVIFVPGTSVPLPDWKPYGQAT